MALGPSLNSERKLSMKDHSKLIGQVIDQQDTQISFKDTILYALSLGLSANPQDEKQLKYTYEENLETLPGMSMVLAYPGFWISQPEYGFEWQKVLHAEESFEIHNPIPPEAKLFGKTTIESIVDRGAEKGCFIYSKKELFLKDKKTLLATVMSNTLARGDGGFANGSGDQKKTNTTLSIPDRRPDITCDLPTLAQSALIYRLCGDLNPLHADPKVARVAGFEAPILHGRCTMGVAMHAIIKTCCDYDAKRLRSMQVRFSAPFMPGETLRTEIWQEDNSLLFRATSVERGVVVLNNGGAQIN